MKKRLVALILAVMISVIAVSMSGCNGEETTSSAVSLVLGNHKYFPAINLNAESVYEKIYNAAYTYGDCSVVVADGEPYVAASFNITKPDADIDNNKRKQIAKQNVSRIIDEAISAIAKTSEIDTLTAISKSASLLKATTADNKEMLVYDSGLSTTGLLDFTSENLIDADATAIAEKLKELYALPDINGINIIWTGLGEVCGEQSKLTSEYKYKLKNIWNEILTSAGGSVEFIDAALSDSELSAELPDCSTVPVVQEKLDLTDDYFQPVKFDENTINFVSDKAEFINADEAEEVLEPIATYLKNSNTNILIVGTTATVGSMDSCKKLSLERAAACKDILVELGADEQKIQCVGIGYEKSCFHINDIDSHGNLIENNAKQNRAVYILDSASETSDEIIALANSN